MLHAATIEAIEETLDRFLAYGQTITSVVVSTPVPSRTLAITDLEPAQRLSWAMSRFGSTPV